MKKETSEQIEQWLKKLERESWQLELLVSGFTIFLLIQANSTFTEYLGNFRFQYDFSGNILGFLFLFLSMVELSIQALIIFLVFHLMIRGFWIGAIGLRSVQAVIDFESFNYSDFFTKKLKKKVTNLDNLIVQLDEICSLMFSFAFLVMSILLSFGLYLLFFGGVVLTVKSLQSFTEYNEILTLIAGITGAVISIVIFLSGLIYLIDYFTLGFFKKYRFISKIYYPFYKFYGLITFSFISRSIYYYLISKFSKRKIRFTYLFSAVILTLTYFFEYDQFRYFPDKSNNLFISANQYDNLRPEGQHIVKASIQSNVISGKFLQLFIRYNPYDNAKIKTNCSGFEPLKQQGINWKYRFKTENYSLLLTDEDFEGEDSQKLLSCLKSLYQISINDSIYQDLNFYYYIHPAKKQNGIYTMIPSDNFITGENKLRIKKVYINDGKPLEEDFSFIPFWYE